MQKNITVRRLIKIFTPTVLNSFVCWYIILVENILLLRTLRGVDFDFNNTKPADTSGQHDLIVK